MADHRIEMSSSSMLGPADILIDLDHEMGNRAPRMSTTESEDITGNEESSALSQQGPSSSSEDDDSSMDSLAAQAFLNPGYRADDDEHSSMNSDNNDDDDDSIEDSVGASTLTTKTSNVLAAKGKKDPLILIQEAVHPLNVDCTSSEDSTSVENSHPLCCDDDSPSCSSSGSQVQQLPSLGTVILGPNARLTTPKNGSSGIGAETNPARALFHRRPSWTSPRKSNLKKRANKEEQSSTVATTAENPTRAVHSRTLPEDKSFSSSSWSHRKLFFPQRRPATPPKRSNNKNTKRSPLGMKSPFADASTRSSRNSFTCPAESPPHAIHSRTSNRPPSTPK